MSKTRLYSIIAAIIIAVSIMLMGKACTNSILKANRETRKKNAAAGTSQNSGNNYFNNEIYTYPPDAGIQPETEDSSGNDVQYVMGILGDIIGTVPPTDSPAQPNEEVTGEQPSTQKSILNNHDSETTTGKVNSILGGGEESTENSAVPPAAENFGQNSTFPDDYVIYVN